MPIKIDGHPYISFIAAVIKWVKEGQLKTYRSVRRGATEPLGNSVQIKYMMSQIKQNIAYKLTVKQTNVMHKLKGTICATALFSF